MPARDHQVTPLPAIELDPGPKLVEPVADPDTLVGFMAMTAPGGGVVAQGLIVIVVYCLYMLAPLGNGSWRPLGGVLVLLMASWGPCDARLRFAVRRRSVADEHGARCLRLESLAGQEC